LGFSFVVIVSEIEFGGRLLRALADGKTSERFRWLAIYGGEAQVVFLDK
jgi:hypothetical protein